MIKKDNVNIISYLDDLINRDKRTKILTWATCPSNPDSENITTQDYVFIEFKEIDKFEVTK